MSLRRSCPPLATAAAFRHCASRPTAIPRPAFTRASFHTTRSLQAEPVQDHYATLNLKPDASLKDIKKSFYTLSKTHHPDHNPTDPSAPASFMRISEAYATLSHPDKRAAYDRTLPHRTRHHPPGSYSSTGPAGGRPASGLSRRRGSFHGPPPSFFRNGAWGAHGAKRSDAHSESTGGMGSPDGKRDRPAGGMGPGQDPFAGSSGSRAANSDVPHFDKVMHERTHRKVSDATRAARKKKMEEGLADDYGEIIAEKGMAGSFVLVCGILLLGVFGPMTMWVWWSKDKDKSKKPSDGRKRAT